MKNLAFSTLLNSVRKDTRIFFFSMEVLKALDKRYRKVWRENRYHSFRRRRK
jgi:hypothetical protein